MKLHLESQFVHGNRGFDVRTGALSFPIYQSATFKHPGPGQSTGYDYSRSENPTREEVEKTLALLERGSAGFAFSSGMAAITAVSELFSPGDHIIVSEDLYGGTYRLFETISRKHGLDFSYIDTTNLETVKAALQPTTRAFFIETPSNPMMKVTDLRGIINLAEDCRCLTIVDNTFLTPYYQRPIELGADIVVHSGTKYLGGHNDTLAGFVVAKTPELAEKIKQLQMSTGATLAPFDSWLILRGIKTLAIRMDKQQANARQIASWLQVHPKVDKVYFVGLAEHEGYAISCRQSSGFGSMISFSVHSAEHAERVLRQVSLIAFAESLGGVESLITYPFVQTHNAIPQEIRDRLGVNDRLLRLSVGIEAVEDLLADLEQALD